jgi:hypothetical protein
MSVYNTFNPAMPASANPYVIPVCATPCQPAVEPQQRYQLSGALQQLICRCQEVQRELNNAIGVELLDAQTPNHSFFGWMVSNTSYRTNHAVANNVDSLIDEACRINHMIHQLGLGSGLGCLDTGFSGNPIRDSENNEHGFFVNWFTNNRYSSMASTLTAQTLRETANRVDHLCNQAMRLQSLMNY